MLLIGMFDSPFVRRVAISMKLLDLPFEHGNWSVGKDFSRIREYNPLGRVPVLVLDDGEVLLESAAILDYLDESVGPARALLPRAGSQRRTALRIMAIASGAAEKGVAQVYESAFRPPEKRHQPWLDRCKAQVQGAIQTLDAAYATRKLVYEENGQGLVQPEITVACVLTFLSDTGNLDLPAFPHLQTLVAQCEALPVFKETRLAFYTPASDAPEKQE